MIRTRGASTYRAKSFAHSEVRRRPTTFSCRKGHHGEVEEPAQQHEDVVEKEDYDVV